MQQMPDVSFLAVLVSAVMAMIIGFAWYSPLLFGKAWIKLSGIKGEPKKDGMGKIFLVAFISTLVMAYVLANFIGVIGAATIGAGMQVAFWAWLEYFATSMLGIVLWEGKSFKLYLINVSHYLVTLLVMGAIIGAWP